jgi:hypothetical protein
MAVKISTNARNKACDSVVDLIDLGSGQSAGYIEIRTGNKPTSPATAATGTLLATLFFSNPAFGDAAAGSAVSNTILDDTDVDATGVAGWFRFHDRDGNAILDGEITAVGGGGDLEFNNTQFVAEGTAQINSFSVTMPE